jgi:hypothetical protein
MSEYQEIDKDDNDAVAEIELPESGTEWYLYRFMVKPARMKREPESECFGTSVKAIPGNFRPPIYDFSFQVISISFCGGKKFS